MEKEILKQIAVDLEKLANRQVLRHGCLQGLLAEKNSLAREGDKVCNCNCRHPEKLQGEPGKCSPERIKECHGDTKEHPCEGEKGE